MDKSEYNAPVDFKTFDKYVSAKRTVLGCFLLGRIWNILCMRIVVELFSFSDFFFMLLISCFLFSYLYEDVWIRIYGEPLQYNSFQIVY